MVRALQPASYSRLDVSRYPTWRLRTAALSYSRQDATLCSRRPVPVESSVTPIIDPAPYLVSHEFLGAHHDRNARRTWMVVAITFVMMIVEIAAGVLFGSMALLADGVHMATHAGALSIAALAYQYARRHQHDA